MSRTGMWEAECDSLEATLSYGRWRGAVKSAIEGRRGQKVLKDLLVALLSMEDKKLITDE